MVKRGEGGMRGVVWLLGEAGKKLGRRCLSPLITIVYYMFPLRSIFGSLICQYH